MKMRSMLVAAAMALAGPPGADAVLAQAQAQAPSAVPNAGRLALANPRATAITEFEAALEAEQSWLWTQALVHARRALAADSSFGLARAAYARLVGGPRRAGEMNRAVADMSRSPAPEALLALGMREAAAGRAVQAGAVFTSLQTLLPNDPRIATEWALGLTGTPQNNALREVIRKFPDYAPPKYWLAFYLTPFSYIDDSTRPGAVEALGLARDAVRQAPNAPGSHTVLGHVLMRIGRDAEALQHARAAASMSPMSEATFTVIAELQQRAGKHAEARAALDTAILLAASVNQSFTYRWYRSLTLLHEGNLDGTIAALKEAVADAETNEVIGSAATIHLELALMSAAGRDLNGAERHIAMARKFGATAAAVADNAMIVYALTVQGPAARRALGDYVRLAQTQAPAVREVNVHRMTGLALLAENKPAEAIAELKQGGDNPYAQLGVIEAYKLQRKKKEYDAELAAFTARRYFGLNSSAIPIGKYRAMKEKF